MPTDTATTASSVTDTVTLAYNDVGQLLSNVGDSESYYAYYQPGTDTRRRDVPSLDTLLTGLTLADGSTTLLSCIALTCPQLPLPTDPPLLARHERVTSPDGSVPPGTIQLYGYGKSTTDAKGMLSPDTILVIEGVAVDTTKTPWVVTKATGRTKLTVSLTQITRPTGIGTTTEAVTIWHGDDTLRQARTVTELVAVDTSACERTTTVTVTEGATTSTLAEYVASTRSGRTIRARDYNSTGSIATERRSTWDCRGRLTKEEHAPWSATEQKADETRKTAQVISYRDTTEGTWITVVGPDGRYGRTLHDGLQRPIRYELQRTKGADVSDRNFIRIGEIRYGTNGDVAEECYYDYLPGGICLRIDGMAMPAARQAWFWKGHTLTTGEVKTGETVTGTHATQQTEIGIMGSVQPVLTKKHIATQWTDGRITHTQKAWLSKETETTSSQVTREETYDLMGRLTVITETSPGASPSTRTWTLKHDELSRRKAITAPDGTLMAWDYDGFDAVPSKVSVKSANGNDTKTTVLGYQSHEASKDTLVMGADKASGQRWISDDGTLTAPDGSKLITKHSKSGEADVVTLVIKTGEGSTATETTLCTYTYNRKTRRAEAARKKSAKQSNVQNLSKAPELLGQLQADSTIGESTQAVTTQTRIQRSFGDQIGAIVGANGIRTRHWDSPQGLPRRVRRDCLEYFYTHDALGQLIGLDIQDLRSGHRLSTQIVRDNAGRETERTYRIDGQHRVRYAMTWSPSGQLTKKTLYRANAGVFAASPTRTVDYTYHDQRDWLTAWTVTGEAIKDRKGRAIARQEYTHDCIDNLTQVVTTFADGATETRSYTYDTAQPTQRTRVTIASKPSGGTETSQTITFQHDGNGNRLINEEGHALSYNATQQLEKVSATTDLSRYEYDEHGRLLIQWEGEFGKAARRELIYSGDVLCGERKVDANGSTLATLIRDDEAGLVAHLDQGSDRRTLFLLLDPIDGSGEEVEALADGQWASRRVAFTPYGDAPVTDLNAMASGMGFNRQRPDPVTGNYHPGHGYRLYDSNEKAFAQSDSFGPFVVLNVHGYCGGDPVNRHDPSGHIMLNRRDAAENLASLDQLIRDTTPPPPPTIPWWKWALVIGMTILAVVTAGAAMIFAVTALGFMLATVALGFTLVSSLTTVASLAFQSHGNLAMAEQMDDVAHATGMVDMALGVGGMVGSLARGAGTLAMQAARGMAQWGSRARQAFTVLRKNGISIVRGRQNVANALFSDALTRSPGWNRLRTAWKTRKHLMLSDRATKPSGSPIMPSAATSQRQRSTELPAGAIREFRSGPYQLLCDPLNRSKTLLINSHGAQASPGKSFQLPWPKSEAYFYSHDGVALEGSWHKVSANIKDVSALESVAFGHPTIRSYRAADGDLIPDYLLDHYDREGALYARDVARNYDVDIVNILPDAPIGSSNHQGSFKGLIDWLATDSRINHHAYSEVHAVFCSANLDAYRMVDVANKVIGTFTGSVALKLKSGVLMRVREPRVTNLMKNI